MTSISGQNRTAIFSIALLLVGLIFASAQSIAQQRSLLALSKADHILAIIDPGTLKITARIPVGPDPHEVVASADGKTAYVTNMGNGFSSEINVIDLSAQKPLPNIDTKPLYGPHGITVAGNKVWFTAQDSKSIGRYDPVAGRLDWSMGTGQDRTHMIYVTPDIKKIYTTNVSSGTVSILESIMVSPDAGHMWPGARPHPEWKQTLIPVSKGSEGFDVSPNTGEIWTASAEDGIISIIDTGSRKVAATIDAKVLGANRLKFTPDGKRVFISSLRSGDLFVYDVATRKEIKKLNMGKGCAGILMDAGGNRAFIASTGGNYIAVIDLKTLETTGRIEIGGPDGMEWATSYR
jgi:YVTN family beta-propeller protein